MLSPTPFSGSRIPRGAIAAGCSFTLSTPDDVLVPRPAQVVVKGIACKEPVWGERVFGRVYAMPANRISTAAGFTIFKDIPLYDAPVLIAEGALMLKERNQ